MPPAAVCRTLRAILAIAAILGALLVAPTVRAQPVAPEATTFEVARFSFNSETGGVLVPVRFNANSTFFLIDTGSTVTIFDARFRDQLGDAVSSELAATPDGGMRFELFEAPRLTVAGLPAPGVSRVACVDFSQFRAISGGEMDGWVGMDFLRDRIVRLDFDRGKAALLRAVPQGSGATVPLAVSALGATVTLHVTGVGDLPFKVDTGHVGTGSGNLDRVVAARLVESGHAAQVVSGLATSALGTRSVRSVRVREIALGDYRHRGPVFDEGTSNLIGLDYLSRYVVTLDFPGKKMYLKPGARFDEPSRFDLSGAHVWRPNGTTTVDSIDRYSAADYGGLRARDVVEEIDSRPAAAFAPMQIRKLLCLPGKHTLRVTRGKATLDIVLDLKEPPDDWPTPADPPPNASPPRAAEKQTPR